MNPSLSIQEEYESLFETLGDAGSAFFKFFDLFRVNLGDSDGISKGVHYGKDCSCFRATDDQLKLIYSTYLRSIFSTTMDKHPKWSSNSNIFQLAGSMVNIYTQVKKKLIF